MLVSSNPAYDGKVTMSSMNIKTNENSACICYGTPYSISFSNYENISVEVNAECQDNAKYTDYENVQMHMLCSI